jgi:biopolymer transport protein ExbD
MIDVMFYLVVFFMIFSTFRTETAGMPLELPRAATAADLERDHLVAGIDSSGRIYWKGAVVTESDLTRALTPEFSRSPGKLCIIKADRTVKYERLIQVIDAIRKAGGSHLALAVERAPGSGGGIR